MLKKIPYSKRAGKRERDQSLLVSFGVAMSRTKRTTRTGGQPVFCTRGQLGSWSSMLAQNTNMVNGGGV